MPLDWETCVRWGAARHKRGTGSATNAPIWKVEGHVAADAVGVAGEAAFADRFGLPYDLIRYRPADDGAAFDVWDVDGAGFLRVRVQTSAHDGRHELHLIEKADRLAADLYVLLWLPWRDRGHGSRAAHLMGWADRAMVAAAPTRTYGDDYELVSHWLPMSEMWPDWASLAGRLGLQLRPVETVVPSDADPARGDRARHLGDAKKAAAKRAKRDQPTASAPAATVPAGQIEMFGGL